MKTDFSFEYSDFMKDYRENNNITTKVIKVELKNKNQLKNKYPKFIITTNSIVYKGTNKEGYNTSEVKTRKLSNETFQVIGGWGQLSQGIIK